MHFQGAVAGQLWTVDGIYLEPQGTKQKTRPLWRVVKVYTPATVSDARY